MFFIATAPPLPGLCALIHSVDTSGCVKEMKLLGNDLFSQAVGPPCTLLGANVIVVHLWA